MKFIHTGDWHIGDSWKVIPDNYLSRQADMIDMIYKIAHKLQIHTIAVSGDLFHRNEPNKESRDMVLSKLLQYDKFFQTIIMEGNHDSVDNAASSIHFLKILYDKKRFKNTIIVECENQIVPVEDGAFLVMPNFNEQALVQMAQQMSQQYKWIVAMLHTTTIGVTSDTNWTAQKGWDMWNVPHITYYALGHIHKFQRLALKNAFQSGSPIQHKWEDKLPKGVLAVDTNNPELPKFIPLDKYIPPLITVKDGENIPEFGFVRLKTNETLIGKELPANVVSTTRDLATVDISEYGGEVQPLKGLPKYLAKEGLSPEEQQSGMDLVEKLLTQFKNEGEL